MSDLSPEELSLAPEEKPKVQGLLDRPIFPFPEVCDPGPWKVEPSVFGMAFMDRENRELRVPLGNSQFARWVRAHEVAHVALTGEFPENLDKTIMNAIEDCRINVILRKNFKLTPGYSDEYKEVLEKREDPFFKVLMALASAGTEFFDDLYKLCDDDGKAVIRQTIKKLFPGGKPAPFETSVETARWLAEGYARAKDGGWKPPKAPEDVEDPLDFFDEPANEDPAVTPLKKALEAAGAPQPQPAPQPEPEEEFNPIRAVLDDPAAPPPEDEEEAESEAKANGESEPSEEQPPQEAPKMEASNAPSPPPPEPQPQQQRGAGGSADDSPEYVPPLTDLVDPVKMSEPMPAFALEWAPMRIHRPRLNRPAIDPKLGRKRRSVADYGAVPTAMHRWATDKNVFVHVKKGRSLSVLFDVSGSMGLSSETVQAFLDEAPASTLATYSGKHTHGELWIWAARGKKYARSEWGNGRRGRLGGNFIDYPALQWLSRQPPPRVWVSDGYVVCINEMSYDKRYLHQQELACLRGVGLSDLASLECLRLCLNHDIAQWLTPKMCLEALKRGCIQDFVYQTASLGYHQYLEVGCPHRHIPRDIMPQREREQVRRLYPNKFHDDPESDYG